MAMVQFRVNKNAIKSVIHDDVLYPIVSASTDPRIKTLIANKIIQYANQYVPKLRGELRDSAHVVNHARQTFITYGVRSNKTQYYARAQYFADDTEWGRTTPGTQSHWLDKVLTPGEYKNQLLTAYIKKLVQQEVKRSG